MAGRQTGDGRSAFGRVRLALLLVVVAGLAVAVWAGHPGGLDAVADAGGVGVVHADTAGGDRGAAPCDGADRLPGRDHGAVPSGCVTAGTAGPMSMVSIQNADPVRFAGAHGGGPRLEPPVLGARAPTYPSSGSSPVLRI